MSGSVEVVLVAQQADCHLRAGDIGQTDGPGEPLVALGVVVLEGDLQLDGLEEVALVALVVGVVEQLLDLRANTGDVGCRSPTLSVVLEIRNLTSPPVFAKP